jgi:hypothetical protein
MNSKTAAITAGAAGALTTNVLHELTRRSASNAPRVDLLGMQALSKGAEIIGNTAPKGRALYRATLAGDLLSNGVYFSGVALAPKHPVAAGLLLGLAGGIGAVVLPRPMGLSSDPTARTATTAFVTVLLYTAGGLAAGLLYGRLPRD